MISLAGRQTERQTDVQINIKGQKRKESKMIGIKGKIDT